ncbi:S-layer homology domain-containing protein [Sporosarcina newyorkensis]|uniref:S-layer homology domain-containing protein n=1 Tax=Sporosarcina newyorkensis TaxID=759851 RepID=A0A1T4YBF8_9BACL|nr:S-layer homology domain-containing protein [Sporosarcina newyorkensis]SKA99013.1 S-layer homology domain-containing protein [Sporosarcina newyorkensis]
MKKRFITIFGALLLACSLPLSGNAASKQLFEDVPPTKHFAEAVNDLAERNIIGGYPDGTFKPGNSITRGQAAAIIAKMIKLDTKNVKNPEFKDVSTVNGYYKAIAAMAQEGIIGGYPDGRYGPNDPIKRGQMASILVKAFDLPRQSGENPFKDIGWNGNSSHYKNILIIYHLGITTGTASNTFSPNLSITRGQAAKMMKATEEAKPTNMVTLGADDFGWNRFFTTETEVNPGLFDIIYVEGKKGYRDDKIQLIPKKEGSGTFIVSDKHFFEAENYKKYYVHVKKENGELKLTMKETNDFLPTAVKLEIPEKQDVQIISLSTMDGKKLTDDVTFKSCDYVNICFDIDKPGQYIATVHFADGKETRYGIEAKLKKTHFYYEVNSLREELSARYEQGTAYDIGKHNIVTKGYEQIVEIKRDTSTNLFTAHLIGKKEGMIVVEYEKPIRTEFYHQSGFQVDVKRIGSIWNVSIWSDGYITDM